MNWDSALIGVVIGSVLSLIGNFANHWFSMTKEEKQWKRQQEAEDKMRKYDEERQEKEKIRNIYHNCISRLSLIEASKSDEFKIPSEKLAAIHQEAFDWLSLLALHQRDLYDETSHNFHNQFREFPRDPDYYASIILQEVYKLAMSDKILFPHVEPKKHDPNKKRFQMDIDKEFMRQQMIEGISLKHSNMLHVDITKIKPSQRQKLWDQNNGQIPETIYLGIPQFNEQNNQIKLKGQGIWTASINPNEVSIEEILDEWEKDFDEALKVANEKLKYSKEKQEKVKPN
jgi:hypothetical protein